MIDVLFRGKTTTGEWVHGYFVRYKLETYIFTQTEVDKGIDIGGYLDCCQMVEVIPDTVGMFTTMLDKNGKKIFEDDIVDASDGWWDSHGPAGHKSPIILVEYDRGVCGFTPFADYDCDCGVYIDGYDCIVIGNIHDNPELLEVQK